MSTPPPPGVYVPAVVFFHENGDLHIDFIKAHVRRLAEGGVTGILVQGSNGEAQHLSHEERKEVITVTRKTLDEHGFQNVLVIAGTGAPSTRETIQLCNDAHQAGASHVLVLTPGVWPKAMSPTNIVRFHTEVAEKSPIPTMIYNFPTVTAGIDLDSSIIGELATHPNIVGTKLSCGNIGKLHRLTTRFTSSEFAVYAGRSDTYLFGLLGGSAGVIAALVNLFPRLHTRLYKLFQDGNITEAMELQERFSQADWAVSQIGGIGALKAVITQVFGYGNNIVRGPLKPVEIPRPQEPVEAACNSSADYYQCLLELGKLEKS